jgi:hypothetical protein
MSVSCLCSTLGLWGNVEPIVGVQTESFAGDPPSSMGKRFRLVGDSSARRVDRCLLDLVVWLFRLLLRIER